MVNGKLSTGHIPENGLNHDANEERKMCGPFSFPKRNQFEFCVDLCLWKVLDAFDKESTSSNIDHRTDILKPLKTPKPVQSLKINVYRLLETVFFKILLSYKYLCVQWVFKIRPLSK